MRRLTAGSGRPNDAGPFHFTQEEDQLDPKGFLGGINQHQVILFHPTLGKCGPQSVVARHRPRYQQCPRGVPVQTMDHTKIASGTKFAKFGAKPTGHETVQQRIILMAPTRLHHPAPGFVEYQVMGIFVSDLESDRSIGYWGRQGAIPRFGSRPRSIIFNSKACSKNQAVLRGLPNSNTPMDTSREHQTLDEDAGQWGLFVPDLEFHRTCHFDQSLD